MSSCEVNGIINVLKPPGMTSHDVIGFIRRTLKIKKAGHTGTLDPGVAGVLPVCLGRATKIIEYMSEDIKQYRAELTLGKSTDTQDGFGEVLTFGDATKITPEEVRETINSLKGDLEQVPPMVSALKHQGKRLYELAREGIEVERKPRTIHIYEVKIIRYMDFGTPSPRILFDVRCSKGTYVRTICHDLGEKLGCGGFMSFLVRTGTGMFKISEALTVEEIVHLAETNNIINNMTPLNDALFLETVLVHDNVIKSVQHGNRVYAAGVMEMPLSIKENQIVKLVNKNNECLATAKVMLDCTKPVDTENITKYVFQPVKVLC